jgi:hypothetical protein
LRSFFSLGFGGLRRRGNGQNLLNGVLEFDAVQSQIFGGFCHGLFGFTCGQFNTLIHPPKAESQNYERETGNF